MDEVWKSGWAKHICICILVAASFPVHSQVSTHSANSSLLQDAAQSIAAGNLERAERELQTILRSEPDNYRALDFLGIIRAQQRRETEAERIFHEVIQRRPDFASGHMNLGLLYIRMNRPESAVPELQEALRLAPDRADAASTLVGIWRGQARAAVSSGDPEALSLLIPARKLTPGDPDVQFDFGMVALAAGCD